MKQKLLLIPLLFAAIVAKAEISLIVQPLNGDERAQALSTIGYVKVTADSLFIYSHSDLQLDKNAIKDVRHIRYGELAEITSIEDVQVSACRIYPNPTQDKLVIENAEGEKVYIFDINGRLLQTANLQNGNATLNVSPLPQGEYLLLLNTQTVKFIKH